MSRLLANGSLFRTRASRPRLPNITPVFSSVPSAPSRVSRGSSFSHRSSSNSRSWRWPRNAALNNPGLRPPARQWQRGDVARRDLDRVASLPCRRPSCLHQGHAVRPVVPVPREQHHGRHIGPRKQPVREIRQVDQRHGSERLDQTLRCGQSRRAPAEERRRAQDYAESRSFVGELCGPLRRSRGSRHAANDERSDCVRGGRRSPRARDSSTVDCRR